MILLNEITIKNFLSHEDTRITFQESEKLLVDGKSGSGKSTIVEAIIWALYGKARTENRALVRRGAKKGANASVSLKLTDGEYGYVITRTTTTAGKNTLTVTKKGEGADRFLPIERTGLKDIQEWIEQELLKASYELFTNSVAYPQENENSFVKATASRRKDLLLEIVRAGNFDDLYDKAKNALNSLQTKSAVTLNEINNTESLISKSTEIASKAEFYKTMQGLAQSQIDTILMVEKDIERQITDASQSVKQVADKTKLVKMLEKTVETLETQITVGTKEIEDHNNFDPKTLEIDIQDLKILAKQEADIEEQLKASVNGQQIVNEYMSNRPNVFDYSALIEDANKRLIALMKETGRCPAGDKCPFITTSKGQIDYLTEQITNMADKSVAEIEVFERWEKGLALLPQRQDISELYKTSQRIKDRIKVLNKSVDVLEKYVSFKDSLGERNTKIESMKIERDQTIIELMSVRNSLQELEVAAKKFDINQINMSLSSLRISKQNLQKELDLATLNVSLAQSAEETIKEANNRLVALKNGIVEAKEQTESLELLKEAFSPRGVKAVIIDYLVPQLEERINGVLSQMSDFRIRLDTQKATVDEEGVKEGLFITVLNDRKEELPFDSYSGGEKVKITVSISEALASLMSGVGFRIMDENIVSLDKESTEGFVEVLEKLQEKFPQLLIISHLQEVKDIFENKITVVKVNGISKII